MLVKVVPKRDPRIMNLKGTPLRKSQKLVDFGRFRWFQTLTDPVFERFWDICTVPGPRWATNNDIRQNQRGPGLSQLTDRGDWRHDTRWYPSSPIRLTFWWKKCIETVWCSLALGKLKIAGTPKMDMFWIAKTLFLFEDVGQSGSKTGPQNHES